MLSMSCWKKVKPNTHARRGDDTRLRVTPLTLQRDGRGMGGMGRGAMGGVGGGGGGWGRRGVGGWGDIP